MRPAPRRAAGGKGRRRRGAAGRSAEAGVEKAAAPRRRRRSKVEADPEAATTEIPAPEDESPREAVGPARPRKPRLPRAVGPNLPVIDRRTQLELNGGAGMYTLPSLATLAQGAPHMEHTK